MFREDVASQAEVDAAKIELNGANTSLISAQTRLEDASDKLENAAIIAPFDGQITERNIEPFQEAQIGAAAMTMQSTGAFLAQVSVPETIIRNVDYGQIVEVTFPSMEGVTITGVVNEIGAKVTTGSAFPVKILLTESELDFRSGMTASVTFEFWRK